MKKLKAIFQIIRCSNFLLITKDSYEVKGCEPERCHISNANLTDQLDMAIVAVEETEIRYSLALDNYYYENSLN